MIFLVRESPVPHRTRKFQMYISSEARFQESRAESAKPVKYTNTFLLLVFHAFSVEENFDTIASLSRSKVSRQSAFKCTSAIHSNENVKKRPLALQFGHLKFISSELDRQSRQNTLGTNATSRRFETPALHVTNGFDNETFKPICSQ